ncbi:XTP/dITP diphosphohydrolase [Azospirillum sp. OGB3]|uniref:non-canonical purine NTP pyrophosphatase n=1 Tax=Azospirillum sp. OGB3 TaxID=2587012 RepID=UPI001605FCEB|nr:XTP/dITP diphosphohydrolase [Azospirillum sp. OGB3]
MQVRFLSSNEHKIQEVTDILRGIGVGVKAVNTKIEELQTQDVDRLVRDKVVKAYREIGHPIFVEHTGLSISHLNGFPGGLTQIFWDSIKADKFSELFGALTDNKVTATTVIAYCDARKVYTFEGSVEGIIAPHPKGSRDFQWDCVFIPIGSTETFAEMGSRKNDISMRRKAINEFAEFLRKPGR